MTGDVKPGQVLAKRYNTAIAEARRFIEKAQSAQRKLGEYPAPSAENAAAKRASLDLTRALADLRRNPWSAQ